MRNCPSRILWDWFSSSFCVSWYRIGLPVWLSAATRRRSLATLATFQPPHSANRHDAGCRGAGADRRRDKMASGLSDHVWTIKAHQLSEGSKLNTV